MKHPAREPSRIISGAVHHQGTDEEAPALTTSPSGEAHEARRREALLKTCALQDAIFNSENFSSIATDEKGVIQIFNVGAERMLGYSAADVVNQITPADISDREELVARAEEPSRELGTPIAPGFEALVFKASRGIEDIYELTYVRKDGSRFAAVVSVTALRDASQEVIGYLLIGTDNTSRKQVEAAKEVLDQLLRDQQFYTRSLIESNIDALMMTDPNGVISDVNQQMIALTGYSREQLIGAPCKTFFTDPAKAQAAISRVLAENSIRNYELMVRANDGRETAVSYNAATFHDQNGKLQGVIAAARDLTERKEYEVRLYENNLKNIELVNASRMKSEFLATMSHELRTPLNSIIGFSEALIGGLIGPLSDRQPEYIGDIFDSGQHLLSLINDILDLSKVEAGMMTLELEGADLGTLLKNSLSIVREKAFAQQIRLDCNLGEDLDDIELDTRKTKQIVYNLLSNAVKFSAPGSCVTLSAKRVPASSVGKFDEVWPAYFYPLEENGHQEFIELSVSDAGIGVALEDMGKLFQPFSQIDSSLARMFEGTGLGLAMVKQLTKLHGGTFGLASAPGEGARFAVWLPLRSSDPSIASPAPAPSHQPAHDAPLLSHSEHRLALIVEDDERAAALVRLLLEAEGFTVMHCTSAESALLVAQQHALSLITLDIQLPGMSGWQFLLKLRQIETAVNVPVVIISGLINGTMPSPGGVTAALQKPVSGGQLREILVSLGIDEASARTRTILIVDAESGNFEPPDVARPMPSYEVVRATGGAEAVTLAQQLQPHLIVVDPDLTTASSAEVVEALKEGSATAQIPIVVMTAEPEPS